MRVALYNPFPPNMGWAEHELSKRFEIAAANLGWEGRTLHLSSEIDDFNPDAVINLHPQSAPKQSDHPSVACLWNPPSLYENQYWPQRHEISHDIHLHASSEAFGRISDYLYPTDKPLITSPVYPSSPHIALSADIGPASKLFYIGSNWDGKRYPLVLQRLAEAGVLALHGAPDRWLHLSQALCGPVPFDGTSVICKASACGLGLCLHLPLHTQSGIPNMRIFELCAAGVLAICGEHPFIREKFAGTVLYVDVNLPEDELADQIIGHVIWARSNPATARQMAVAAQQIFLSHLTLERLLSPLPDLLTKWRRAADADASVQGTASVDPVRIEVVIPWDGKAQTCLESRLTMLAGQTCSAVHPLIVAEEAASQAAEEVWNRYRACFDGGRAVSVIAAPSRSTLIWAGLRATAAPWVALLSDDITLFPDHFRHLLGHAVRSGKSAVCSGVLGLLGEGEKNLACANPDERLMLEWFDSISFPGDGQSVARAHPAAALVRGEVVRSLASKDPLLDQGAEAFLLRRIADIVPLSQSWQISARSSCRPLMLLPEGKRLDRLEALLPKIPPAPLARATWSASMAVETGPGDLPVLVCPSDFAALPEGRPILIYGTSRGGRLIQLELMKWEKLTVVGFIDSFSDGIAHGRPVRRLDRIPQKEIRESTVVIASMHRKEIFSSLRKIKIDNVYDAYPYIEVHNL